MMRTGNNNQDKPTSSSPLEPGIVTVAEIAFAALLLYLTNHPFELNDLTHAKESTETPVFEQSNVPGEPENPTTIGVAVASTTMITIEPLIK